MIYPLNDDERERIKQALNEIGTPAEGIFMEKDRGKVEIYNVPPTAVLMFDNEMWILGREPASELYAVLQLNHELEEAGLIKDESESPLKEI